jgi:hypothetical protein
VRPPAVTPHPAEEQTASLLAHLAGLRWAVSTETGPARAELRARFLAGLASLRARMPERSQAEVPGGDLLAALPPSARVYIEALRAQQAFNEGVETALAHYPVGAPPAALLAWCATHLPDAPARAGSHRRGAARLLVNGVKALTRPVARLRLQPWLEPQGRWNQAFQRGLAEAPRGPAAQALLDALSAAVEACRAALPRLPEDVRPALRAQLRFLLRVHGQLPALLELHTGRFAASYAEWLRAVEPPALSRLRSQARSLPQLEVTALVVHGPGGEAAAARTRSSLSRVWRGAPQVKVAAYGDDEAAAYAGLAAEAAGEWLVLVRGGDEVAPASVVALSEGVRQQPDAAAFYSDEDWLEDGARARPHFKQAFSSDRALESDDVTRLLFVRRDAWARVGGVRAGTGTAGLVDLVVRLSREGFPVGHLPWVLCHRTAPGASPADQSEALSVSAGVRVEVVDGRCSARRVVVGRPRVTAVVPFRDGAALTRQLLGSLDRYDPGVPLELLLVSNGSVEPETEALIGSLANRPDCRVVRWDHPFNYSILNNVAAAQARGAYLLLLNNDVEALHDGWLAELVAQAQRPEVGAVGCRLLFPDGRLQHAGVVLGPTGFAVHPFWHLPTDLAWSPFGLPDTVREYSAVTAACLLMRRQVFEQVGGFDPSLVVSGGDVDLCLRVRRAGYRVLYTPRATLRHHESATRRHRRVVTTDAWNSFRSFRPELLRGDPHYHPHLALSGQDCLVRTERHTPVQLAAESLLYQVEDALRSEETP